MSDAITKIKLELAELTIKIGKVIMEKWTIRKELNKLQEEESALTKQIADETERLEKIEDEKCRTP